MSMWTADEVLSQIYRELEVSIAAGTHYYSGVFTVDKVAYYWKQALISVQPLIVQSDLEPLVMRVSGVSVSTGFVTRPSDFHVMLAAKIGTVPLHVDSPGSGLDRMAWLDPSMIPTSRASISTYSKTSFVICGSYGASDLLSYIYLRKPHRPSVVALMDYDNDTGLVTLSNGEDVSLYEGVYLGGVLFDMDGSDKYEIITSDTGSVKADPQPPTQTDKTTVIFALPEIPDEYIDPMIAKTCLLLCNGEDRNGWRERFAAPSMMGSVNVDPGPRVVQQTLWDTFD